MVDSKPTDASRLDEQVMLKRQGDLEVKEMDGSVITRWVELSEYLNYYHL